MCQLVTFRSSSWEKAVLTHVEAEALKAAISTVNTAKYDEFIGDSCNSKSIMLIQRGKSWKKMFNDHWNVVNFARHVELSSVDRFSRLLMTFMWTTADQPRAGPTSQSQLLGAALRAYKKSCDTTQTICIRSNTSHFQSVIHYFICSMKLIQ